LSRRRFASEATATSSACVAKLTEMKAPMAMMKTMMPIWPNRRPTISVSTISLSGLRSPYTPLTGARISCCTRWAGVSGESMRV